MRTGLRLADLLGGLSTVADLGFGLPPQTALRSCLIATALAHRLDLPGDEVRDCFYTALLMHVGCVSVAHESRVAFGDDIALNSAVARTDMGDPEEVAATLIPELTRDMSPSEGSRVTAFAIESGEAWGRRADTGVCEVARKTAARVGLPESTQLAIHHVYEAWIGGWVPSGLQGDEIPRASRIARAATDAAVFAHLGGAEAALAALRKRGGVLLDPTVVDAFAADPDATLALAFDGDPRDRILDAEPPPVLVRPPAELLDVAAAFGDLVDLKAPSHHGHARETARLAAGAAKRLGLSDDDVRDIQVAGLLHDVGRAGVSNAVWEKPGPLTRGEWEQVRMHAYHSERILATSPSLEPLATLVGMHHERLDGSGYHRGATNMAIALSARILAVSDAFAAMLQSRPHRSALVPEQAAEQVLSEGHARRFDPDAVAAVLAEAGHPVPRRRERPAGLSEREVEVLGLMAGGSSNAEVARRLFISRRTAEHHAQHIYTKIGVSTRAAAALFAVEHDLLVSDR